MLVCQATSNLHFDWRKLEVTIGKNKKLKYIKQTEQNCYYQGEALNVLTDF